MENSPIVIENSLEKVYEFIIDPMLALWGGKLEAPAARIFVNELARFDIETLKKAFRHLSVTSVKKPALASIINACWDINPAAPESIKASPQSLTESQIDEVMNGYPGTLALREGWGWQLYEFLTMTATSTFVPDEVMATLKLSASNAWDDQKMADKISAASPPFREIFEEMWKTLIERKSIFEERYVNS